MESHSGEGCPVPTCWSRYPVFVPACAGVKTWIPDRVCFGHAAFLCLAVPHSGMTVHNDNINRQDSLSILFSCPGKPDSDSYPLMYTIRYPHLRKVPELNAPLVSLKGIGPKRFAEMAQCGITTILDIMLYLPFKYRDKSRFISIKDTVSGAEALLRGKIVSWAEEIRRASGKRLFKVTIDDGTGEVDLVWFNYKRAYLLGLIRKGLFIMAFGKVQPGMGLMEMIHPDVSGPMEAMPERGEGIVPVYRSTGVITGRLIGSWIKEAFARWGTTITDFLPERFLLRLGLPGLSDSLKGVHFPDGRRYSFDDFRKFSTPFHRRLMFDGFFSVMLPISAAKNISLAAPMMEAPKDLKERLESALGFSLTADQARSLEAVSADVRSGHAMRRLLEGDVGCGKTAVAAGAALIAIMNGWQAAIMVPTQILARQHHEFFLSLSPILGFRPCLFLGRGGASERRELERSIECGESNLIIGTHSLINEGLIFRRLGLIVFDEQHRFGVGQRLALSSKGENPHILIMTATPIPRSLALTLYAEEDISVIRELPAERKKVITLLAGPDRKQEVFVSLKKALERGERGMVICPVIEETEEQDLKGVIEMAERLERLFPAPVRVGFIHGRLSAKEKDEVMERFRRGDIHLLVGTTVLEVGIHVPQATVMIVEHPERFGLAQLHQLRGRVGRSGMKSVCYLMVKEGLGETALMRLKALAECTDGFEISLKDLEFRGHGELAGLRQSGAGDIALEYMLREPLLLKTAKALAREIITDDPLLERGEHIFLREIAGGPGK